MVDVQLGSPNVRMLPCSKQCVFDGLGTFFELLPRPLLTARSELTAMPLTGSPYRLKSECKKERSMQALLVSGSVCPVKLESEQCRSWFRA